MIQVRKPVILTFISFYLPGYKAGGILRTIANTVEHLGDEFEFRIVALDRDLKETEPYPNVESDRWQPVGKAQVYYLPPRLCTLQNLARLVTETPHDILYLNSFFDYIFTIRLMLARRLGMLPRTPLLLAPRGEFVEGPLRLKYPKKFIYIHLTKMFGFYRNIAWQASSDYEKVDIIRVMKADPARIHVALDLPAPTRPETRGTTSTLPDSGAGDVRLVFLSRLTREKNLDYALKVLARVKTRVTFNIYGPAEDASYWDECQKLMKDLPKNVLARFHGSVKPDQVPAILASYDLFFFPTSGENYGHVIAEALSAGTRVLISNETPWRDLESAGLGWDLALEDMDAFAAIIDRIALTSPQERVSARALVRREIEKRLQDPDVINANRQMFLQQLAAP